MLATGPPHLNLRLLENPPQLVMDRARSGRMRPGLGRPDLPRPPFRPRRQQLPRLRRRSSARAPRPYRRVFRSLNVNRPCRAWCHPARITSALARSRVPVVFQTCLLPLVPDQIPGAIFRFPVPVPPQKNHKKPSPSTECNKLRP